MLAKTKPLCANMLQDAFRFKGTKAGAPYCTVPEILLHHESLLNNPYIPTSYVDVL